MSVLKNISTASYIIITHWIIAHWIKAHWITAHWIIAHWIIAHWITAHWIQYWYIPKSAIWSSTVSVPKKLINCILHNYSSLNYSSLNSVLVQPKICHLEFYCVCAHKTYQLHPTLAAQLLVETYPAWYHSVGRVRYNSLINRRKGDDTLMWRRKL